MKTYRIKVDKGFKELCLNPLEVSAKNSGLFSYATQVKLSGVGLAGFMVDAINVIDESRKFYDFETSNEIELTKSWPFPQVFSTDDGIYIGALEGLFKVVSSDYPDLVLLTIWTGSVVWPWTCVRVKERPAFTNGAALIYYNANTDAYKVVT